MQITQNGMMGKAGSVRFAALVAAAGAAAGVSGVQAQLVNTDPTKSNGDYIAGTGIPSDNFLGASGQGVSVFLKPRGYRTPPVLGQIPGQALKIAGSTFINITDVTPPLDSGWAFDFQFTPREDDVVNGRNYTLQLQVDLDPLSTVNYVNIPLPLFDADSDPLNSWDDQDGFFTNPSPGAWSNDNVDYVHSQSWRTVFGFLNGAEQVPGDYRIRWAAFAPEGNQIAEVAATARLVPAGTTSLTLDAADDCLDASEGQLVVEVNLTNAQVPVSGGQFLLEYDTSRLSFVSMEPGSPVGSPDGNPFETEISETVDPVAGTIDYGVGQPIGSPMPTSDNVTMARITFNVSGPFEDLADLVSFRAAMPDTRLSDAVGNEILPLYTSDLGVVTDDNETPVVSIAAPGADSFTVGGFQWDANRSATSAVATGTFSGATFGANWGSTAATSGFDVSLTMAQLTGLAGHPSDRPLELGNPDGMVGERDELELSGFDVRDNAGDDFVVYENGGAGAPEGFAVAVVINGVQSAWRYEFADIFTAAEGTFATGFDLADFGYTAGDSVDAIVLTNLLAADTVDGSDGQGVVTLGGGGGFVPDTGPLGPGGAYANGRFDPDITYVGFIDDGSVTVNADAGLCTAVIAIDPATATDNYDDTPTVVGERSDLLPLDAPYPAGPTTITWTATDDCGNSSFVTQQIVVNAFNDLAVNVEIPGLDSGTERCITFELTPTGGGAPVVVKEVLTFTGGSASATIDVPCGDYECITARDELHTLMARDDDGFAISGTGYVADFTGPDALVSGNFNDDEFIDILDFGVFIGQFGLNVGPSDCSTAAPHADASGDGMVDGADFTFVSINFLAMAEGACPGSSMLLAGDGPGVMGIDAQRLDGPVTAISVAELEARGLGHLALADLNADGVLDPADIAAFMGGALPDSLADVTGDGFVDLSDLRFMADAFRTGDLAGDVNRDGRMDLSDLTFVLERMGRSFGG